MARNVPRIAIGCQGGGSHTAFTAGALRAILREQVETGRFEVVALSGTSGGAVCALLAWYGLLEDGGASAVASLERFWTAGYPVGNAASLPQDQLSNATFVQLLRLPVLTEVSPYSIETWLRLLPPMVQSQVRPWLDAQSALRSILEDYVDFDRLPRLVAADERRHELMVGAINVLSGDFQCFRGTDPAFSVEAVVASATLPELMRAARIGDQIYWDGLYSQNPPIECFFAGSDGDVVDTVDQIWVIRVNPRARAREPQTLHEIHDRRNELAGNLSLEHELALTRSRNELAQAYETTRTMLQQLPDPQCLSTFDASPIGRRLAGYRTVNLPPHVVMADEVADALDYASKLSRDPGMLRMLLDHGEAQAATFLQRLRQTGDV